MARSEINGLPIIDAKQPLTLVILDRDIDKASRKEPLDCAVARACRRGLHAKEVKVHKTRIYVRTNDGNWTRYMTPPSLGREVIVFDRGGTFAPGEYVLIPPTPAKKATGKQQGSSANRSLSRGIKKGSKRRTYHVTADVRSDPFGY